MRRISPPRRPRPASGSGAASSVRDNCGFRAAAWTSGLPDLAPREAAARGIRTLVIGIANDGGFIAPHWVSAIVAALEAGPRRGLGPARAARRRAGNRRGGEAQRRQAHRGAPAGRVVHAGHREEAQRQSRAHGRNRLRRRQEVHGARDREGNARARRGRRLSRDGANGHLHLGPRHRGRLGRLGLRVRRGGMAVPGRRAATLGRDRRPGIAVPPGLRGRDARAHPRQPARRDGAVPRPRAHGHRRLRRLSDPDL